MNLISYTPNNLSQRYHQKIPGYGIYDAPPFNLRRSFLTHFETLIKQIEKTWINCPPNHLLELMYFISENMDWFNYHNDSTEEQIPEKRLLWINTKCNDLVNSINEYMTLLGM
jgi:hypothetical protein